MGSETDYLAVQGFLRNPDSQRFQIRFWETCARISIGYLRVRATASIPLRITDSDPGRAITDTAASCLTHLMEPVNGRPFAKVFDYYDRYGFSDFANTDPQELYYQLTVLIRGHIKRQMYKAARHADSNFSNIEKSFRNILTKPPYIVLDKRTGNEPEICLERCLGDLREDLSPIPDGPLRQIVEETWLNSLTYPAWCEGMFERLNTTEYQNFLSLKRLVRVAAEVRSLQLEFEIDLPSRPDSPDHIADLARIEACLIRTLDHLDQTVLQRYVKIGRLSEDEVNCYLQAFESYVRDGLATAECDSYPEYFRVNMPEETHVRYLSDYKYTFESTMNVGKNFLMDCLEIESTDR